MQQNMVFPALMSLNTHSPVPLYRQLAEQIGADIDAGVYAVSARIPSETDFADRLSIGRPTVRQATDLLVRQGRLERRRGSGTYVLPPTKSIDLFSLAGTSAALNKSGQAVTLELVHGPVRERFGAELGDDDRIGSRDNKQDSKQGDTQVSSQGGTQVKDTAVEYLRIERKACVDNMPVMYETLRFDASLFGGLEKHNLANQSLSALVRDVFFLEPTSANQTFFAITADKKLAGQLDVKKGAPLLHVHRELHFGEHISALHADIICRTDHFEFSQTLYPAQSDVKAAG